MAKNRTEKFVENNTEREELNSKISILENKVSYLQHELNKKARIYFYSQEKKRKFRV